jgi:hypothetical protein
MQSRDIRGGALKEETDEEGALKEGEEGHTRRGRNEGLGESVARREGYGRSSGFFCRLA